MRTVHGSAENICDDKAEQLGHTRVLRLERVNCTQDLVTRRFNTRSKPERYNTTHRSKGTQAYTEKKCTEGEDRRCRVVCCGDDLRIGYEIIEYTPSYRHKTHLNSHLLILLDDDRQVIGVDLILCDHVLALLLVSQGVGLLHRAHARLLSRQSREGMLVDGRGFDGHVCAKDGMRRETVSHRQCVALIDVYRVHVFGLGWHPLSV